MGEALLQPGRLYAWHLALTLTAENVVPIVLDWMRLAPVDTGHLSFRALGAYRTKPARIGWSLRLDVLWWAEFRRKIVGPRGTIAGSDREFKKQALVMALDRNHVWAGRANAMEAGIAASCNCREALLGAAGHAQMRVLLASRSRGGTIRRLSRASVVLVQILGLHCVFPFSTSCIAEIGCQVFSAATSRPRPSEAYSPQKHTNYWSQFPSPKGRWTVHHVGIGWLKKRGSASSLGNQN
jgi:hypothetical protein